MSSKAAGLRCPALIICWGNFKAGLGKALWGDALPAQPIAALVASETKSPLQARPTV